MRDKYVTLKLASFVTHLKTHIGPEASDPLKVKRFLHITIVVDKNM